MPVSSIYYDLLEISVSADETEIKKAYRRLAVKYHPDKNPGDKTAEDKFKKIAEAYDILSNPDKRKLYDQYGENAFSGSGRAQGGGFGGGTDPFDIFSQFFGGGRGGGGGNPFESFFGGGSSSSRRASQGVDGNDLKYNLEIDFEDAVKGVDKKIEFTRSGVCDDCRGSGCAEGSKRVTCRRCGGRGQIGVSQGFFTMMHECPACHGSGNMPEHVCKKCSGTGSVKVKRKVEVHIPPGVDSGTRMRVSGEGEPGLRGGENGDLYIVIYVKEHSVFTREGDDIHCDVPITFSLAALGGDMEIPTINGPVTYHVPAGTQNGDVHRIVGKGMPSLSRRGSCGNHIVRFFIEVPKKLTDKQKEILREYASSFDEKTKKESHPIQEGFFKKLIKKVVCFFTSMI